MVKLQKLYTLQSRCYMSVNRTQLNMISSLKALVPWLSMGFCLEKKSISFHGIMKLFGVSIILYLCKSFKFFRFDIRYFRNHTTRAGKNGLYFISFSD